MHVRKGRKRMLLNLTHHVGVSARSFRLSTTCLPAFRFLLPVTAAAAALALASPKASPPPAEDDESRRRRLERGPSENM